MKRLLLALSLSVALVLVGCSKNDTPTETETGTAPSAPTLSSPANGSTGVSVTPTLSWSASSGATSYSLQASTDNTFASTVTVNQASLTSTSYSASSLANSTTYYWRVNATNSYGTSSWSSVSSFTTVAAPPSVIWEDGFETYVANSWPSNWTADGNGTDSTANYVDNTIFNNGAKSIRLFGIIGSCWGALAYRELTVVAPYEIEVKVRNGNDVLSGCHPDRAYIGLRQGTSWVNPSRVLISFMGDGSIRSGALNILESSYSTLAWYTVRIFYERPSSSQVKISYWINGVSKGYETLTAIAEEDQLDNLDLTTQEGTVWFDDVKVIK